MSNEIHFLTILTSHFWTRRNCFQDEIKECRLKISAIFACCAGFIYYLLSDHSIKPLTNNPPHALYPNSSKTKRCRLKTNMPFGSLTTKVYLGGLAFWFLQSFLRYGPERKGLKREYFQWKGTFCSTFGEFQLKQFFQFTLQGDEQSCPWPLVFFITAQCPCSL